MENKPLKHVNRPLTEDERQRHAQIREAAERGFPPSPTGARPPAPPGIPAKIRAAREARGMTWYALAQAAGVPNSGTVRDIEEGRDVKLSDLRAIAAALGLKLDVVEQTSLAAPVFGSGL